MTDNSSKMQKLLELYCYIRNGSICGRGELLRKHYATSIRMIQRYMKELTDAGMIKKKYHGDIDEYLDDSNAEPTFNESTKGRYRQHLIRLNRLCTLIDNLTSSYPEEISEYETLYEYYIEDLEDAKKHPEKYDSSNLTPPDKPILEDARECYHKLFPDCSSQTMRRDFKELRYVKEVLYYPKYKVYLVTDHED